MSDYGLIIVFISLFAIQTIIYSFILLRLRSKVVSMNLVKRAGSPYLAERPSETMLRILRELSSSDGLRARDLSMKLGLSREHVARLLKRMVEEGLIIREGKPYRYRATGLGKRLLKEYGDG